MASGLIPATLRAAVPALADLDANAPAQPGQQLAGVAEQHAVRWLIT
ncbi:hypothetical protein [Verrucomicrobium spinosum]|nr:hypothetical protein [Verrucomicrobium spinosum]